MNFFGNLIRIERKKAGFTQQSLSDGILSSKTLSLIETGEQDPSIEILDRIGDRLGIDFFQYLPYSSCEDPTLVKNAVEQLSQFRLEYKFAEIKDLIARVEKSPDFGCFPWNAELFTNEIFYKMYYDNDFKSAKEQIRLFLKNLDGLPILKDRLPMRIHPAIAQLYNLQGICEVSLGNTDGALKIYDMLVHYLLKKKTFKAYHRVLLSSEINYIHILNLKGLFQQQLEMVDELISFQRNIAELDRIYFSYYLKGLALYYLERKKESIEYFQLALLSGLSMGNTGVLKSLLKDGVFISLNQEKCFEVDLLKFIPACDIKE